MTALQIRDSSTLRWPGALAQLGERRLCKPEVTGSIPVRSTEKGPGNGAFSFSSQAPSNTQIGLWSTGWSTEELPNPMEASDFRTFSRSSASRNCRVSARKGPCAEKLTALGSS